MSDTSPAASETQPAPLPWFERDQTGDAEPQPWRPTQENVPLFGITFSPSPGDHWRCHNRILWVRPDLNIIIGVFIGGYSILKDWSTHVIGCIQAGQWILPKMSVLLSPFIGIFAALVVAPVCLMFATGKQVFAMRRSPASASSILATTHHIHYQTPKKSGSFKWKEVWGIVLNSDDVYIHGLPIDSCIYIPRAAFSDAEAAKRFHAALVALWQGRGDPNRVPAEICTEFPPPLS